MSQPERAIAVRSRSIQWRLSWGVGVSLALHGAVVLGLLLIPHALSPEIETPAVELVLQPATPETEPPAQPQTTPPDQTATPPEPEAPPLEPPPPQEPTPLVPPEPIPPPPPAPTPAPKPEPAAPPARLIQVPPKPRPHPPAPASGPSATTAATETPAPAPTPPTTIQTDPAWLTGVSAWLLAHRSYPEMARRLEKQGTVVVQITVDPNGQVQNVTLVQGSGSELLDQAAQALVRNAHLPPFPADMKQQPQTVTLPIRYRLE